MKSFLKTAVEILLITALTFSLGLPAFAADENDVEEVISYEVWFEEVSNECQKYGFEVKKLDEENSLVITREELDETIAYIREIGETYILEKSLLTNRIALTEIPLNEMVSPFSMPVTREVEQEYGHNYMDGSVALTLTADVTIDVQSDYVISVSNIDVRQTGESSLIIGIDFEFVDAEVTYVKNSPQNGYVTFVIDSRVYVEGGDRPHAGFEVNFVKELEIDVREYL